MFMLDFFPSGSIITMYVGHDTAAYASQAEGDVKEK
jgi:hypothetical protein